MRERILRFVLKAQDPMEVFQRFHPNGEFVLNSTEWRGKEPRTCCVTKLHSNMVDDQNPRLHVFNVEVSYRPPGFISFTENARYDGWTLTMVDRQKDGMLLDGTGQPLKENEPIVYLPFQVYRDTDFNKIDFGEFVEEIDGPQVVHRTFDEIISYMNEKTRNEGFSIGAGKKAFVVPRRSRPYAKIVIANHSSQSQRDGFGTRISILDASTPHLSYALYVKLTDLMIEFLEGKIMIKAIAVGEDEILVELSDSLVDARSGQSRFDVLEELLPDHFLDDLAKQVASMFQVEAEVVTGKNAGLFLRRQPERR